MTASPADLSSRTPSCPIPATRRASTWPSLLFPQEAYITDYTTSSAIEYWSEAVTDWVYGENYQGPYNDHREPLSVDQAKWIERFTKGWGW